ncbi:MAG: DUF2306 domain-containing protein [Burkholderiaceae bacterium]
MSTVPLPTQDDALHVLPAVPVPLPPPLRWLVALLAFGVAGYALFAYGTRPLGSLVHPDMMASFRGHPWLVYGHVFAAAVALAIGPFQFVTGGRRSAWHRALGRIYLGVGVGLGGACGLVLAFSAHGGGVAQAGFALLALAWLGTGARALTAILRGAIDAHRRWMLRNYALTLAAVTLRLYLPASMLAGLDFDRSYAAIAWLCWVPNLLVAQWLLERAPTRLTGVGYRST